MILLLWGALPDEKSLVEEIDKTRKALEARRKGSSYGS